MNDKYYQTVLVVFIALSFAAVHTYDGRVRAAIRRARGLSAYTKVDLLTLFFFWVIVPTLLCIVTWVCGPKGEL